MRVGSFALWHCILIGCQEYGRREENVASVLISLTYSLWYCQQLAKAIDQRPQELVGGFLQAVISRFQYLLPSLIPWGPGMVNCAFCEHHQGTIIFVISIHHAHDFVNSSFFKLSSGDSHLRVLFVYCRALNDTNPHSNCAYLIEFLIEQSVKHA